MTSEAAQGLVSDAQRSLQEAQAEPLRKSPNDITLFSSQGLTLEDLAAARLVYDRAKEKGVGREVDF